MKLANWLLGLAATAGAVHLGAKLMLRQVAKNPDIYPLALLSREPEGEETILTRPDGTALRLVAAGHGPTVLLAHGLGATLQEWNIVWAQLRQLGYQVIAFDQRGHGRSTVGSDGIGSVQMAGDYKAILEHFDLRDTILVGHSMGGFLANVLMLTYPDVVVQRLKGTVLFATFAGNALKGSPQNRLQIPLIKAGIMDRVIQSDVYGSLFVVSLLSSQERYPAIVQACLQIFRQGKLRPLLPIVQAFCEEDYYGRLPEINTPCVVICGREDKTTPPWHSEQMGQLIPHARTVWVEGKGHLLNWEAPQVLVQAIQSF